jgi:hypothetical protein
MSKIDGLKAEIESLPREEFAEIFRWLTEKDWERWDMEIETDSQAGKLDFMVREAHEEKAKGTLKDLLMHRTSARFWTFFAHLPEAVQLVAR